MENKNIRLVYIGLAPYNSYAGGKKIGETLLASPTFALKEGMSMEEAYKVISYLSLKVERDYRLNPGCRESVIRVCSILENYGFKKINEDGKANYHATLECPVSRVTIPLVKVDDCVNLYTVDGHFDLFRRSNLYSDYFEWFNENVKESEFNQIINKHSR